MKLVAAAMFSLLSIAIIASAGEIEKQQMKIVVSNDKGDTPVMVKLDSDNMGFSLSNLADGETRSVVDENGQTVLVTRNGDNFELDVSGQKIALPGEPHMSDMHEVEHKKHVFIKEGGGSNVDVRVIKLGGKTAVGNPDDITIISGKALGQSVKDGISSVLTSAGHAGQIVFIDGSELSDEDGAATWMTDGEHVKVIRKTIEVTQ